MNITIAIDSTVNPLHLGYYFSKSATELWIVLHNLAHEGLSIGRNN